MAMVMPRTNSGTWIALACSVWLSAALAAEPGASPGAAASESQDVVVEGKSLSELRSDVKKTERRFRVLYERFNEDVDQQVSCADSAATGTRFTKRSCTTRAAANATSEAAQDYAATSELNTATTGQMDRTITSDAAGPTLPVAKSPERYVAEVASVDLKNQGDAYSRNLAKLMSSHPELRKRYEEYSQARLRLEAAERRGRGEK
jgi:hypothetical protein